MEAITRAQDALAELADELAHAEVLIEEQAERIESLEAEVAVLRNFLSPAAA
jgi:predicted  nucleic acid-binding Zn-ribbon protein